MRDDLKRLPLPPEAKSYARRHGMASIKRQPQNFINMVAAVTNQRDLKHGFKNTDAGETMKEDVAKIVNFLTR